MATGTAFAAVDMSDAFLYEVEGVPIKTKTQIRLVGSDGEQQDFFGSGFKYSDSPDGLVVLGGTVSSTNFTQDGQLVFKVGGLAHDAGFIYHLFVTNDNQGLLGYVFNGADTLVGSAQGDVIIGYAGPDVLKGAGGADVLKGAGGNDKLIGGAGKDVLVGGPGLDKFIFDEAPNAKSADTIKDFQRAQGDKIVLDHLDYDIGTSLGLAEFRSAKNVSEVGAKTASQHILYDSDSGKLYYDADGNGTDHDAVLVATLANKAALAVTDFVVI